MVRMPYKMPTDVVDISLDGLLSGTDREMTEDQLRLVEKSSPGLTLHCAGDLALVQAPCVAVVGSRDVSDNGRRRARRLARELAAEDIVIVSGLARGVDTEAMTACIDAGGRTIGVLGTGLDKATPAANGPLQTLVYEQHLLVSQFDAGARVFRGNFPRRNRTMAALSNATVIVEATDSSGTLHQAAEALRLGRWLFILRSLVQNPDVTWPSRFLGNERTVVLESTADIVARIR